MTWKLESIVWSMDCMEAWKENGDWVVYYTSLEIVQLPQFLGSLVLTDTENAGIQSFLIIRFLSPNLVSPRRRRFIHQRFPGIVYILFHFSHLLFLNFRQITTIHIIPLFCRSNVANNVSLLIVIVCSQNSIQFNLFSFLFRLHFFI